MITAERKAELVSLGYEVEDLSEYGEDFVGMHRWVNERHTVEQGDGFGDMQCSSDDAWADASQFCNRYGY